MSKDLKPLTQEQIDAVPEMKGWTIDGFEPEYLKEPDGREHHRTTAPYKAITILVNKLLSTAEPEKHPLFCGYVEIKGVKRELRTLPPRGKDGFHRCPGCDFTYTSDPCEKCGWGFFAREGDVMRTGGDYTLWIAPTPKEPEMDEFEKALLQQIQANADYPIVSGELSSTLKTYREFVTRKGEQQ